MTTTKIARTKWEEYFDAFSKHVRVAKIDVLIESRDLGAQVETQGALLRGISYDPDEKTLDVMVEGLDHRISDPIEIFVQEEGGGVRAFEVIERSGQKQVLQLSAPLALPKH